ncbi:DUF2076 domain-containing protein [Buchnera aphidicola (Hyperomyzus lactucae)]|uniref:DUF2076 domain-containing protein n=1 Tax=Buchnera aphidicola (Hyperomyzus lactucae) TaxID=1241860 RepID=A0A4D6Y348_9GAMM|nr:DUF2076 domain-containing protein [Buchnera aphidicola]QCI20918.1 DUF2076 domain-containing protein [Buchnera aphidicola (Hyperomyzus lactucae)]
MKDEEKNLIENLFHRLKSTELNSSEKDISADELIQKLVKKQPSSSYYMAQTILIQETAIKKMSAKIEELKKRINILNNIEGQNKKPSFLSNFFKKNSDTQKVSHDNNLWKYKENPSNLNNSIHPHTMSSTTQTLPAANNSISSRSSGFLSNALQTATGVAGGMILGNMLMNVFNHSKPEEEIFDTIHHESTDNFTNVEENMFNHSANNNLVDYEYSESDINSNELNSDYIDNDIYNADNDESNDDNFI